MSIEIEFNGKQINSPHLILSELIAEHSETGSVFAVALNQQFIAKDQYTVTELKHGDSVELLSPMQGG